MLKKFIIFVIDDLSGSGTPDEMVAIDAFNDSLRDKGHWIFAGGLTAPVHANVIDNVVFVLLHRFSGLCGFFGRCDL